MDPIVLTIAVVIVLGIAARTFTTRATNARTAVERIRAQWGKAPRRKDTWRDASLYHDLKIQSEESWYVGERTWDDLYMPDIFHQIDHCRSRVGSQVLYDLLRTPSFRAEEVERRNRLICLLDSDPDLREHAQVALEALETEDAALLANLFFTT